jgi:conjugative relaxase-like TrwC/TraI family protein
MLSIRSLGIASAGVEEYYEHLAQGDEYYESGGEPPGQWQGLLASELYLFGQVQKGQLGDMFRGIHPLTGEALATNAGDQHKVGWDLTFSAPKSVSTTWAFSNEEARRDVERAHNMAVTAALSFLEKRAFSSRDRDQHGQPVRAILAATYQHATSRELDPQLHTHATVANLGMRADGTFSALDFDTRYKMAGGAIYRAELAAQLIRLGYRIERDDKSFKIAGVDQSICNAFSKRRSQIVERLQQTGFTSAKAASFAALNTRSVKQLTDRKSLFKAWQDEAKALSLDVSSISNGQLLNLAGPPLAILHKNHHDIDVDAILKDITTQASTFTSIQLEAALAREAQGLLDAQQIDTFVRETIAAKVQEQGPYALVRLKEPAELRDSRRLETQRFTTREMLEIERQTIRHAVARQTDVAHVVSCEKALIKYPSLSDEQVIALRYVTENPGAVKAVRGLAGTGKSYLLKAAKESWTESKFNVTAVALAGKAAQSLEEASGIKSQTLHSLLNEITAGKKTLSSRDILVIDEAGMIGSRQMHDVLRYIHAAGAKAVLVGDPQQLQPIDAGGIFRSLSDKLGCVSLTEIRRQESESDRLMIHDLISGKADDVINSLIDREMLEVVPTANVYDVIVDQWANDLSTGEMQQSLILAGTKADVYKINILARERMIQQHHLHSEVIVSTEYGDRNMAVGERIMFTQNSRSLGIKNGQTGNLAKWHLDQDGNMILNIHTDAGKTVALNLTQYKHLDYGYALSVHKAQGQTVDKVYVLVSDVMTDREWLYVATSRHRKQLKVFVPQEQAEDLASLVNRSRQKDVTQDYLAADHSLQNQLPDFDAELEA